MLILIMKSKCLCQFVLVAALWPLLVSLSLAQPDRSQARSMVVSRYGIVASENPLASQAGAMILARGGTACDAAVAANAAMSVVEPMMCGPGGDLFALVYDAKSGQLYGLNASGWSPKELTITFLRGQGRTNMPQSGIHSVTVPGAVAGWNQLLKRFGRQSLAEVLVPAIHLAEDGFPVAELTAGTWADCEPVLQRTANTRSTF